MENILLDVLRDSKVSIYDKYHGLVVSDHLVKEKDSFQQYIHIQHNSNHLVLVGI